uniref:Uncharacterized protein n=1 Tax=Anguilla anguilla TaxID=7936 RepID=A0A0E9RM18_ANGAN
MPHCHPRKYQAVI